MSWCRKCGTELGWFNTGAAGDLCKTCQGEKDEERRHRHEVEIALEDQAAAARAAEGEIKDRRERAKKKEQAKEEREKKRQQLETVNAIIAFAETIAKELEAVPADRGVQLDTLAKLANFFPSTWEGWFLADSLIPHRAEIAYARHRASVVPLLEAVLEARAEFPTSPNRLLRTLATSFLLKDFDAIRSVQRDLPARLEPIRQLARDVVALIKEKEAAKRKLKSEWQELDWSRMTSFFSAMKGRTKAVVESEMTSLDEDIVKDKQVIAGLEEEAKRARRAFEMLRGDPAMRAILEAIDGEVALLEAIPTATTTATATKPKDEIGQPSFAALPEADGTAPEHVEVEPWEVARRWAARHRHVVYWLLVGVTFPIGLIVFVGVAATGQPPRGGLRLAVCVPAAGVLRAGNRADQETCGTTPPDRRQVAGEAGGWRVAASVH